MNENEIVLIWYFDFETSEIFEEEKKYIKI
jgi:hypothetical protein